MPDIQLLQAIGSNQNTLTNMDDTLIDFNHIYYLLGDKLFKEQFSPTKEPFNFEQCFKSLDLDSLQDDTSFFFLEHSVPPLHQQLRHFLKQQGYIEDNSDVTLDSKLTDKGVETVEKGGITSYKSFRQRQEELQIKIQESTLSTNFVSRVTAIVTTIAVMAGLLFSYWTYMNSKESNQIQRETLRLQESDIKRDSTNIKNYSQDSYTDSTTHKK